MLTIHPAVAHWQSNKVADYIPEFVRVSMCTHMKIGVNIWAAGMCFPPVWALLQKPNVICKHGIDGLAFAIASS
jgi:hypothetical protein